MVVEKVRKAYRRYLYAALRWFNNKTVSQVQAWPDGTVIIAQRAAGTLAWDVVFIHATQFAKFQRACAQARAVAEVEGESQVVTWEEEYDN